MTTCEINFRYHTVVIVPTKSTAFAREIKSGMNYGTSSRYLYPTFVNFFTSNENKSRHGGRHSNSILFIGLFVGNIQHVNRHGILRGGQIEDARF